MVWQQFWSLTVTQTSHASRDMVALRPAHTMQVHQHWLRKHSTHTARNVCQAHVQHSPHHKQEYPVMCLKVPLASHTITPEFDVD